MVFGFEVPKRECHLDLRNFKSTTLVEQILYDIILRFVFREHRFGVARSVEVESPLSGVVGTAGIGRERRYGFKGW